jgi:hypothetical protein
MPHLSVREAQRIPRNGYLVMHHWHAATYRYLLHVEAGRTDVNVVGTSSDAVAQWDRIVAYLAARGRPTLIHAAEGLGLDPRALALYRRRTPPVLARHGLLLAHDPAGTRRRPPPASRGG